MKIVCELDPNTEVYTVQLQANSVAPEFIQEESSGKRFSGANLQWGFEADGATYQLIGGDMTLVLDGEITPEGTMSGFYKETGDGGALECQVRKE